MSQHWHGHWIENAFAPKRLRNWEVSKWYPSWPDRHCVTTKFIANDNGHILNSAQKAKHPPWGIYKGTWNLPKKITRSIAEQLSATPQYKKDIWELHKKKHRNLCKEINRAKKKEQTKQDSVCMCDPLQDTIKRRTTYMEQTTSRNIMYKLRRI